MNAERARKVPVVFYRTPAGAEVVRNWLRALNEGDRNAIGQDLMRVQYRLPVGMPLCRPWVTGCGKCEAIFQPIEPRVCCSAFSRAKSLSFTVSSRSPGKRRIPIWLWRGSERENFNIRVLP